MGLLVWLLVCGSRIVGLLVWLLICGSRIVGLLVWLLVCGSRITVTAYEKHFPNKRVKLNKYKHKLSPWITAWLINSIEFRDKLY